MGIDSVNQGENTAQLTRRLATKKNEVLDAETNLATEKYKTEREGKQKIQETIEKNNNDLVMISKQGEQQAQKIRQQQKIQIDTLAQNTASQYEKLANEAAMRIKAMNEETAKQITSIQQSNSEKLTSVQDRSTDPFYRLKTIDAALNESETDYRVVISLPAHEAQNLSIATDQGNQLKLSLKRAFEAQNTLEDGRKNRTYSYQTITETIALPGKPDISKMSREYADGKLTITVGKYT